MNIYLCMENDYIKKKKNIQAHSMLSLVLKKIYFDDFKPKSYICELHFKCVSLV